MKKKVISSDHPTSAESRRRGRNRRSIGRRRQSSAAALPPLHWIGKWRSRTLSVNISGDSVRKYKIIQNLPIEIVKADQNYSFFCFQTFSSPQKVANTVYIKARTGGQRKGKSKKWRQYLQFPSVRFF